MYSCPVQSMKRKQTHRKNSQDVCLQMYCNYWLFTGVFLLLVVHTHLATASCSHTWQATAGCSHTCIATAHGSAPVKTNKSQNIGEWSEAGIVWNIGHSQSETWSYTAKPPIDCVSSDISHCWIPDTSWNLSHCEHCHSMMHKDTFISDLMAHNTNDNNLYLTLTFICFVSQVSVCRMSLVTILHIPITAQFCAWHHISALGMVKNSSICTYTMLF